MAPDKSGYICLSRFNLSKHGHESCTILIIDFLDEKQLENMDFTTYFWGDAPIFQTDLFTRIQNRDPQ